MSYACFTVTPIVSQDSHARRSRLEHLFLLHSCMRELIAATAKAIPIIPLIDLDESRGGLSLAAIHMQLLKADSMYNKWGLDAAAPRGEALYAHLFAAEPIEWNRIGHFQDVTMRLIANAILWPSSEVSSSTYVDCELLSQQPVPLAPPRASYHVYASTINPRAAALVQEVANDRECLMHEGKAIDKKAKDVLYFTTDKADLCSCDHMLLYLTAETWTRGDAVSDALAAELIMAMELGVHVLLAHEMPGVGGQEERHGCEFCTFFSCLDGATPESLLRRGVYDEIAVPLKGGPYRKLSLALLGMALRKGKGTAEGTAENSLADDAPSARPRNEFASLWQSAMGTLRSQGQSADRTSVRPTSVHEAAHQQGHATSSVETPGHSSGTASALAGALNQPEPIAPMPLVAPLPPPMTLTESGPTFFV